MNSQLITPFVDKDPDVMGGQPVFAHTRVPVGILFGYLAAGEPLSEFFENYPGVKPEQVYGILDYFQHQFSEIPRTSAQQ
jgi:uncharacterized protein (DUF433 family)